jgi:hypothetical protein
MAMDFLKLKETGINYSVLNITDLFIMQQLASLCCCVPWYVTLCVQWNTCLRFLWGTVELNAKMREILNAENLTYRLVTWDH